MSRHPEARAAILALSADGDLVPLNGIEGAFIRKLSIGEMTKLSNVVEHSGAQLLMMSVVDEAGKPLFKPADIESLLQIKAEPFRNMVKQAGDVNGMTATAGEDAVKN